MYRKLFIGIALLLLINNCASYRKTKSEASQLNLELISKCKEVTYENPVADIQINVSNEGKSDAKIMDTLEVTSEKFHRCYALYVKIMNPEKCQMLFRLNGYSIMLHTGFKYVKLHPQDTIRTNFQINFKELFFEWFGDQNLNFGTYTITVTLRDLYKHVVPDITSEPLYIDYKQASDSDRENQNQSM